MHLNFIAKNTSYDQALDGDIIQVCFEENENENQDTCNQKTLYLALSINYEFPPITPSISWFDGKSEDGGAEILNYKISRNTLQLWLNNNLSFDITFSVNEEKFNNIEAFFSSVTKNIKNA